MNQTETLHLEKPYSFTDLKKAVVNRIQDKRIRLEKNPGSSINNYLKTPEEIDAELALEMNSSKTIVKEHKDHLDTYGTFINNYHRNSYSPDYTHSGFMEENY